MNDNVTQIWQARQDVRYVVYVTHKAGGEIELIVEGIGKDQRDREAAARALEGAAALCRNGVLA
jgi:hypothetical protein